MPTIKETYLGDLRVECQHVASGTKIITDAPVDNQGKGEAFSPTDLCATALGACATTIMGIWAKKNDVDIVGMTIEVTKHMSASPRRIGKVEVVFNMPAKGYSDEVKKALMDAAYGCPVKLSLHPDTEQVFTFNWAE
ncbi:MAG: OsmC family protein [Mailhella sp.]|nr:OsmC family protein [Mailhella sp.]